MILVLLGTQDKQFARLLQQIDTLKIEGKINEDIVAQVGHTKYVSSNMEIIDFLPYTDLNKMIDKANLIITHGGVGSIMDGIKKNKKVIAVPRLKKYGEHVNDHQLQIINSFRKLGYILGVESVEKLNDILLTVEKFEPKQFISNNRKIIKIIEDFIEN